MTLTIAWATTSLVCAVISIMSSFSCLCLMSSFYHARTSTAMPGTCGSVLMIPEFELASPSEMKSFLRRSHYLCVHARLVGF